MGYQFDSEFFGPGHADPPPERSNPPIGRIVSSYQLSPLLLYGRLFEVADAGTRCELLQCAANDDNISLSDHTALTRKNDQLTKRDAAREKTDA